MKEQEDAHRLEAFFRTLGDANRLRIIKSLGSESRAVSQIVTETGLSQPLVSHHLRVLREAELVSARREGPFVRYRLVDEELLSVLGVCLRLAADEVAPRAEVMFRCPGWWAARRGN